MEQQELAAPWRARAKHNNTGDGPEPHSPSTVPQSLSKTSREHWIQTGVQSIRQVTRQVQGQVVKAAHKLRSDPVRPRVRHHLAITMKVHTDKKRLKSS